jgi:type IV secretion system protein VirB10
MAKDSSDDLLKKKFNDDAKDAPDTTYDALNEPADEAQPDGKEKDAAKLEGPKIQKISNNQLIIVAGLVVICVAVIAYFWLSNGKKDTTDDSLAFEQSKPKTSSSMPAPSLRLSSGPPDSELAAMPVPEKIPLKVPPAPQKPEPAPLLPVSLPTPPPAQDQTPKNDKANEAQSRQANKIKSSIMLVSGTGGATSSTAATGDKEQHKQDANTADGDFNPTMTNAVTSKVTKIGDMSNLITQGKIIDSVLETPISTLNPGPIRAVISRDVYSDKGSNILIRKGSKLVGTLKGGYAPGATRIAVEWNRIILPSGHDISMTSAPGVGKLGMLGIEGTVNRQFMETIGNAALLSIINISASKMVEDLFKIQPQSSVTTTNTDGSRVVSKGSQSPTQQAAQAEFQNLSNITKDWLRQNFVATPYIIVNQGTRVKVFVNQDIRFPKFLNGGANFIR